MQLTDILIDPHTSQPLHYSSNGREVTTPDGKIAYPVVEEVPVIRTESKAEPAAAEIHQRYNSTFNYTEHYQTDAEYFDYFEAPSDPATLHENRRLHEAILARIPSGSNLVLDVGCGGGWLASALLPEGKKVISMDISTKNPITALKNNPGPNHFGLVADVYQLPIAPGSVDCIVAAEIIEHVADPRGFIAALLRALKPGGKLIVTTPYDEKLEYNLCIHCNKPTPKNAHLHSFNEQNIRTLIPKQASYTWDKFSNKFLAKLRTHVLLSSLPFTAWKTIDSLANKVAHKEARLLLDITAPLT